MPKRFFLKLIIVGFVLLNLLITPNQVSAQADCSVCDQAFDSCSKDILSCPIPSLCLTDCVNKRDECLKVCNGGPSVVQQYCETHKDADVCKIAPRNGQFCDGTGIKTAIGCIPTELNQFIPAFLRYAYAIGGGIALLLMIIGAFQMITSAGNPEAIKKGKEQFVAAATGLLFIVLSTAILHIIGVDILSIPGFK